MQNLMQHFIYASIYRADFIAHAYFIARAVVEKEMEKCNI